MSNNCQEYIMNYNTVYEKRLRTMLCAFLWCSPYIYIVLLGCESLREVIPLFFDYFIYIFLVAIFESWIMIGIIEICSRRKKCFSRLHTKRLLKKYSPVPATIVKYRRIPHSTSRPGKWIESIPILDVDGTEMIGNSFVGSSPEIGTDCIVIIYKNKCWIIKVLT